MEETSKKKIVKQNKKRKSETPLNPNISQGLMNPLQIKNEEMCEEIQEQFKRLRLNSSPLVSPKIGGERITYMKSHTSAMRDFIHEQVKEENKGIEEEILPIEDYREINLILGQIYYENRMEKYGGIFDINERSSGNKGDALEIEFEIDEEMKQYVEEHYRKQNKYLNKLWYERMNSRMLE